MKTLELKGARVEVSEGKRRYCILEWHSRQEWEILDTDFVKAYKNQGNLENLKNNFGDLVIETSDRIYEIMRGWVEKYIGQQWILSEPDMDLLDQYIESLIEPIETDLENKWRQLYESSEKKKAYRAARKANRTRRAGWGIDAAFDNASSWTAHTVKNAVGNAGTSIATSAAMSKVFKDKERIEESERIIRDIYAVYYGLMLKYVENTPDVEFEMVKEEDSERSRECLKTAENLTVGTIENVNALKMALEYDPSNENVYKHIILNYGDQERQVEKFAAEFYVFLSEWKKEQVKSQIEKDNIQDLSSEAKIIAAIDQIKKHCEYFGVLPEDYTKDLLGRWCILDRKLRTVEGIEYDTRKESDAVKADLQYLAMYSVEHSITSESEQELKGELQTEAVISTLAERIGKLERWQNFRNMEEASKEIVSSMPFYEKIKGCFLFGNAVSQSKKFEHLKAVFSNNQQVAFVYDNALVNKGKKGILLTNSNLIYYNESEIKKIALNDFKEIELAMGEIIIHQLNGEDICTGIQVKIDPLDSFCFSETVERVILMCEGVKNADEIVNDEEVYAVAEEKKVNYDGKKNNKKIVAAAGVILLVAVGFVAWIALKKPQQLAEEVENTSGNEYDMNIEEPNQEESNQEEPELPEIQDQVSDEKNEEFSIYGVSPEKYLGNYELYLNGYKDGAQISLYIYDINSEGVSFSFALSDIGEVPVVEERDCIGRWDETAIAYGNEMAVSYEGELMGITIHFPENGELFVQLDNVIIGSFYPVSEEETIEGEAIEEVESDYILPESSEVYLSEEDLEGLTAEQCKIARNEIYARHGRLFSDEELQSYFDSCAWYDGYIEPEDFSEELLTEVELTNLQTISSYEKNMGYRD